MARPWIVVAFCTCLTGWICAQPLYAQVENGETKTESVAAVSRQSDEAQTTAKPRSKYMRLPRYYGKLNLSAEQKNQVYSVQVDYGKQMDELLRKLATLKTARDEKVQSILTKRQKEDFVTYINAALAARMKRSEATK